MTRDGIFARRGVNVAVIVLAALLQPRAAHAYIDPNAGGWLFQMLMPVFTVVAAGWLLLRRWLAQQLRRLLNLLARAGDRP